jgi:hypothetical protein
MGNQNMDNPEELGTLSTQDKHHYAQANTNNINKTWALLQTTGSKDESNTK